MNNKVNRALAAKERNLIFALIAVLAITFASCGKHQATTQTDVPIEQNTTEEIKKHSDTIIILYKELEPVKRSIAQKVYNIPKYKSVNWDTHKIENIQCIQDQWMRVPRKLMQDSLIVRLLDAYNACVVWHSVGCDMEVFWRWEVFTDSAMLGMDLSNIKDIQTRRKAKQFIAHMAAAQRDTSIDVQQIMDQYLEWTSERYNITNFCDVESITEEAALLAMDPAQWISNYAELKAKRGLSDTIFQQQLVAVLDTITNFNAYCVLAIEYAHSSADGPWARDALPYLEKALTSGIYSPLLSSVWRTWRASLSTQMGESKDSNIPNAEYNQLRMLCCYTMLCYIHDYPDDIFAIDNYLTTSYWDNICRYGAFPFGNQSMIDRLEIFPEWEDKMLSK